MRMFAFGSAGTLLNWSEVGTAAKVLDSTRVSAGMGVAVPTPIGRFEVTFAKVFRMGERDDVQALQYGLNINFG